MRLSGNKIIKSVSFNITNENDIPLLARIENVNFSGYVKRLIEKDLRQRKIIKAENKPVEPSDKVTEITANGLRLL
jgi:hypothetical protein